MPFEVWRRLLEHARTWTGYTHGWRSCDSRFRQYLMASVETHGEAIDAELEGWRYFRIRRPGAPILSNEVACPYETRTVTCERCLLCSGARRAKNLVITVHGPRATKFRRAA